MVDDDVKVWEAEEVVPALLGGPHHCQEFQLDHAVTSLRLRYETAAGLYELPVLAVLLKKGESEALEARCVCLQHGGQIRVVVRQDRRAHQCAFDVLEGRRVDVLPLEDVLGLEEWAERLCCCGDLGGVVGELRDEAEERAEIGDIRRDGEFGDRVDFVGIRVYASRV